MSQVCFECGVTKIFIKRAVSNDYFFDKSSEMISCLSGKFAGKGCKFVEIDSQALVVSRAEETRLNSHCKAWSYKENKNKKI